MKIINTLGNNFTTVTQRDKEIIMIQWSDKNFLKPLKWEIARHPWTKKGLYKYNLKTITAIAIIKPKKYEH